jgi:thiamine pyrophosphokinase
MARAVTVILADGAPPAHEVPLAVFRGAARVIACDGAWRTAVALGRIPDMVVGDGDSIDDAGRQELARLGVPVVRDREQDTNDLCKAFRRALESGAEKIAVLGATGRRDDHALGNIFHLAEFAESCPGAELVTDGGTFAAVLPPGASFRCTPGEAVSVFAPRPDTQMESDGLEWPLAGVVFDTLWRGTLNRTVAQEFSLRTNRTVLVFRPHPKR